jgi:hypothetical protein
VAGETEPAVVVQERIELQREKTVLGQKMPGALAPLRHMSRRGTIEEHHGFGGERTGFCCAERQHIDAGLPGDLSRARIHPHQRVGEARAVHVHLHAMGMRDLGERCDLVGPIDRAGLARLRKQERRRDHLMRCMAFVMRDGVSECLGPDLAARARHADKLEA